MSDVAPGPLVEIAFGLLGRDPELAVALAGHVRQAAEEEGDHGIVLRARQAALAGLNRLDRGVTAMADGLRAVEAAQRRKDLELAGWLRLELGTAARVAGVPEAAEVLAGIADVPGLSAELYAAALVEQALLTAAAGDGDGTERIRRRADQLLMSIGGDHAEIGRARLLLAETWCRRGRGTRDEALRLGRAGLGVLAGIGEWDVDGARTTALLAHELVDALLDLGRRAEALAVATPVLSRRITAATAGPTGWLRLNLAERLHLTSGAVDAAAAVLEPALSAAVHNGLHVLAARCMDVRSRIAEARGEWVDALRWARESQVAERCARQAVEVGRLQLALWLAGGNSSDTAPVALLALTAPLPRLLPGGSPAVAATPTTTAVTAGAALAGINATPPRVAPTNTRNGTALAVEPARKGPSVPAPRLNPEPPETGTEPDTGEPPTGRHGRAEGSAATLPGGYVVRPGSGGRRRADPAPEPVASELAEPEKPGLDRSGPELAEDEGQREPDGAWARSDAAPPRHCVDSRCPDSSQPEAGLGLADLLAEAMAAFHQADSHGDLGH